MVSICHTQRVEQHVIGQAGFHCVGQQGRPLTVFLGCWAAQHEDDHSFVTQSSSAGSAAHLDVLAKGGDTTALQCSLLSSVPAKEEMHVIAWNSLHGMGAS